MLWEWKGQSWIFVLWIDRNSKILVSPSHLTTSALVVSKNSRKHCPLYVWPFPPHPKSFFFFLLAKRLSIILKRWEMNSSIHSRHIPNLAVKETDGASSVGAGWIQERVALPFLSSWWKALILCFLEKHENRNSDLSRKFCTTETGEEPREVLVANDCMVKIRANLFLTLCFFDLPDSHVLNL